MVVPLGPGKFYGTSLPRPRFYTDVKLNDHRVDPPVPVLDPFISWAQEAHWSMGGLSFKRLRLQGRIEGNVKKLRSEREKTIKKRNQSSAVASDQNDDWTDYKSSTPSPPPAPVATKRRRFTALFDEENEDEEVDPRLKSAGEGRNEVVVGKRRTPVRKLGDDFDRVATESGLGKSRGSPLKNPEAVAARTRSRKTELQTNALSADAGKNANKSNPKGKKLKRLGERLKANKVAEAGSSTPVRSSPRLAKRR